MSIYKQLEETFKSLRLSETAEYLPELLKKAENQSLSYTQFLMEVMAYEQRRRGEKVDREKDEMGYVPQLSNSEFSLSEQPSL